MEVTSLVTYTEISAQAVSALAYHPGLMMLTEFLGTMLLIVLGNGIVANVVLKNTKGHNSGFLAITIGWATAVFVAAAVAGLSGGVAHLNPAVTIGVLATGHWTQIVGPYYLVFYILMGSFLGAIAGQIIVNTFYRNQIKDELEKGNPANVLGMHSTGPTHKTTFTNFFSEFVATSVLVSVVMVTIFFPFNSASGSLAATGLVALTVLGIGLSLGGTTGYAINPFRDLGPRIVHQFYPMKGKGSSDWGYSWIPVLAPLMAGAMVGLCFMNAMAF